MISLLSSTANTAEATIAREGRQNPWARFKTVDAQLAIDAMLGQTPQKPSALTPTFTITERTRWSLWDSLLVPSVRSQISGFVERQDIGRIHVTAILVHHHTPVLDPLFGSIFGFDSQQWSVETIESRDKPDGGAVDLVKLTLETNRPRPMKITSDQAIALLKQVITEDYGNITQDYLRVHHGLDRNNKERTVRQQALDALVRDTGFTSQFIITDLSASPNLVDSVQK